MKLNVINIQEVAERQLCTGCGACAYVHPDGIEMVDTFDQGRRPRFIAGSPDDAKAQEAMRACPGANLEHTFDARSPDYIQELVAGWGPVMELWEGYAADPEIRFAGSSGGAATALALFAMEQAGFSGTVHIAARSDVPYLNKTVFSTSRDQLMAATGSRYAPASPCDGLHHIEQAAAPAVFIGKPCDVAGANMAAKLRPQLEKNLGLTIGIFCAGTPSIEGTLSLMNKLGVPDPADAKSVRYRGNGWPGNFTVTTNGPTAETPYRNAWGHLTKFMQWRCRVCPDHTGEFADIAVGDPWYKPVRPGDPGQSLVVARTARGRDFLHRAIKAGYLVLERREPHILPQSQDSLMITRGNVWARMVTSRLMGAAAPRFRNMPLFIHWWRHLGLKAKVMSFAGTAKRVVRRKLRHRLPVVPWAPPPPKRQTEHVNGRDRAAAAPTLVADRA